VCQISSSSLKNFQDAESLPKATVWPVYKLIVRRTNFETLPPPPPTHPPPPPPLRIQKTPNWAFSRKRFSVVTQHHWIYTICAGLGRLGTLLLKIAVLEKYVINKCKLKFKKNNLFLVQSVKSYGFFHSFLTCTLDGVDWPNSHPVTITCSLSTPWSHMGPFTHS